MIKSSVGCVVVCHRAVGRFGGDGEAMLVVETDGGGGVGFNL